MIIEIIGIIVSVSALFLLYFARLKSTDGRTFLFSNSFLNRADESIFNFIKFVFKLYSLLSANISTFLSTIPHKVINGIHVASHYVAQRSNSWVDKITNKTRKK